jgi:hypothetical protein
LVPLIWIFFQAAFPPVGFLEVTTAPRKSTAAQKLTVGQET